MKTHKPPKVVPHYFCNKQLNLAYLRIQKCACTSIETWMAEKHENYDQSNPFLPHSEQAAKTYFDEVVSAKRGAQGYFRFSFVRHPTTRFLSFYNDKIGGKNQEKPLLEQLSVYGLKHGMPIEQCLEKLIRFPDKDCLEPHCAPQHQFILHEEQLRVDFIGRLETFDTDIKILANSIKTGTPTLKANVGIKKENILSIEAREMIAELYHRDFVLLGYDPND